MLFKKKKPIESIEPVEEKQDVVLIQFRQAIEANIMAYKTKLINKKEYEKTRDYLKQQLIKHKENANGNN